MYWEDEHFDEDIAHRQQPVMCAGSIIHAHRQQPLMCAGSNIHAHRQQPLMCAGSNIHAVASAYLSNKSLNW
jgi:hypothetical protein